jgi:hypothetical protein
MALSRRWAPVIQALYPMAADPWQDLPGLADLFDSQTPQRLSSRAQKSGSGVAGVADARILAAYQAMAGANPPIPITPAKLATRAVTGYPSARRWLKIHHPELLVSKPDEASVAPVVVAPVAPPVVAPEPKPSPETVVQNPAPKKRGTAKASAKLLPKPLPWKPGHLRSAYGAICCHKFKPKNQTDDIFLAQILGHKLLGPNASLSAGQGYKDFYIRKP